MYLEICALVLFVIVLVLWYSGLFTSINVKVASGPMDTEGDMIVAYKFGTGAYKNVGPSFKSLYDIVPKSTPTVGFYYDNPHVSEERCVVILNASF
jgi:hypothetical protein